MRRNFIKSVLVLSLVGMAISSCSLNFSENTIYENKSYTVTTQRVEQGDFEAYASSHARIVSTYKSPLAADTSDYEERVWELNSDLSAYPSFNSHALLVEAMYNMSLEEAERNISATNTFDTGAKWKGVWTRDISYSTLLSLAITHPKIARKSLLKKVFKGKIIQDTGTGGSWPVSSDRMTWSLAAWELFNVSGDYNWLRTAYEIIQSTLEDDLKTTYDAELGLFRGESSFLDWREQSYPAWMQPADIYQSYALGTQAVYNRSLQILSEMAQLLNDHNESRRYARLAEEHKEAINKHFWLDKEGYYGQYLYGKTYPVLSDRSESLGNALCVIFGIADEKQRKRVIYNLPVQEFGVPSFYPHIADQPAYHNNGIWPFVQAYWVLAAKEAENFEAVEYGMAGLYRAAALFLTNKENMVSETGDFNGTEINSDRQLWSVAGNLAMVYRMIFGLEFKADHLEFHPFLIQAFDGNHMLSNFKYRNAILNITVKGYGNEVLMVLDGEKVLDDFVVPSDLSGVHDITVVMSTVSDVPKRPAPALNNPEVKKDENDQIIEVEETAAERMEKLANKGHINLVEYKTTPTIPIAELDDNSVYWAAEDPDLFYEVFQDGELLIRTNKFRYIIEDKDFHIYQLRSVDTTGLASFLSQPMLYGAKLGNSVQIEAENFSNIDILETSARGYSGKAYVRCTANLNTNLKIKVSVPESGLYRVDFRYANGNGPITSDSKCGIRSLQINNFHYETVVFPQRGKDAWSDWGFSSVVDIPLKKGSNELELNFERFNANMDGEINEFYLDYARFIRIGN